MRKFIASSLALALGIAPAGALTPSQTAVLQHRNALAHAPACRLVPETYGLLARMTTQPSAERACYYNDIMLVLKSDPAGVGSSIISRCPAVWPIIAAHSEQAAQLNWASTSYTLAPVNSPLYTVDFGYTGNGSSSYLTTGITLGSTAGVGQDNLSLGGFLVAGSGGATSFIIGGTGTGTASSLRAVNSSNMGAYANANNIDTQAVSSNQGLFYWSRPGGLAAGHFLIGKDGASSDKTRASVGLATNALTLLRQNNGASYSSDTVAAAWVCQSLNAVEIAALRGVLADYLTHIGAYTEVIQPPPDPPLPAYFDYTYTIAPAGLRIFGNNRPPSSDTQSKTTYAYWPNTDVAPFNLSTLLTSATTWSGKDWAQIWVDRANSGGSASLGSANPLSPTVRTTAGYECRTEFTSRAKAQAATRVKTLAVSGQPYAAYAASEGLTTLAYATLAAAPNTYCTGNSTTGPGRWKILTPDTVVIPTETFATMQNPQGIVLDWEPQDNRPGSETVSLISTIAGDMHGLGKNLAIYTNPLNASGATANGFDSSSIQSVMSVLTSGDFFSILLWSGNREGSIAQSYNNQKALFGATWDPTKIFITFELGVPPAQTTLADALFVRTTPILADGIRAVFFWRHNATMGGTSYSLTNQKIDCIASGTGC